MVMRTPFTVLQQYCDNMSIFNAVYTDIPLEGMGLPSYEQNDSLLVCKGRLILLNGDDNEDWPGVKVPGMHRYYVWNYSQHVDFFDFARDYLNRGELLLVIPTWYDEAPAFSSIKEIVEYDMLKIPQGTVPSYNNKNDSFTGFDFERNVIYRFTKGTGG